MSGCALGLRFSPQRIRVQKDGSPSYLVRHEGSLRPCLGNEHRTPMDERHSANPSYEMSSSPVRVSPSFSARASGVSAGPSPSPRSSSIVTSLDV
jgi:hypothetical protein